MLRRVSAASGLAAVLVALPCGAEPEPPTGFVPRFVLETGRRAEQPAEPGLLRLQLRGEWQLRGQLQSDVPLTPPPGDAGATRLGQEGKVWQWLRMTPRLQVSDWLEVVAQADVTRGLVAGTTTRVGAATDPEEVANPVQAVGRWLYAELRSRVVSLRVGQQPNHVGLGLLFNDGDHPSLFGDYRHGDVSERAAVTVRPGGRTGLVALLIAGDLVLRDAMTRWVEGERAWQGLAGVSVGGDRDQVGLLGVVRRQTRSDGVGMSQIQVLDAHGRFAARVPGGAAYLFGEAEAAFVWERQGGEGRVMAAGAAARLGVVREQAGPGGRFADVVGSLGWGYASGDDDAGDGRARRFLMHPDFNVGLVLFDHVLHWKTARSATLLGRGPVSDGGVAGAAYVNPTVLVRPRRWLDARVGLLVAQATSDVVDLFRAASGGKEANFDGGDVRRRDLGLELDAGVEVRWPLAHGMTAQAGVQGGVLFPGHAFDDGEGRGLGVQHVEALRLGFQF